MEREIIKYRRFHGLAFTENDIPKSFPSHWHNEAEFIVALKNSCKYKIDGKIFEPKAGDILLVWPRELHELLNIPQNGVVFIQFSSYLIESNSDLLLELPRKVGGDLYVVVVGVAEPKLTIFPTLSFSREFIKARLFQKSDEF